MPLAGQRRQIQIGDAPDFDIIQRQFSFKMYGSDLVLKIGPAHIQGLSIKSYSEFGSAPCRRKFDVNVPEIDPLFESVGGLLGPQTGFDRMIAFAKLIDQTLLPRPVWIRRRRRRWRVFGHLLHLPPETEWSHISPYFFNVGQTLRFEAALSYILPPERYFLIIGPDGILLFVVDDDFVNSSIFSIRIMKAHYASP